MYQTQKVSKLIKPGEGTKLTQGASPQKKLEDKREQEKMRKTLISYDISDSQIDELTKNFDDPVKKARYLESFNLINSIQKKNQDNKVVHRHGFQRIQKILDEIEYKENERLQIEENEFLKNKERDDSRRAEHRDREMRLSDSFKQRS